MRSISSPVESVPVTIVVELPPVVPAVRAGPADVGSAQLKDPIGGRPPVSVPPADVVALSRRVEACEGALSPHCCSLQCERLKTESNDSSALVSQLREKL
uniref:Uncharacterized protein n=1 Tax=Peronospora matthiolae TaxID=2874970 RepID=A0AAV1TLL7_9STRA